MKKWIIGILSGVVLIVGAAAYYFASQEETMTAEEMETTRQSAEQTVTEEVEQFEKEKKNPFGDEKAGGDLTDSDYQQYIHAMSHQKVKADKKWTNYVIHPERIDWLLQHTASSELQHGDTYTEILTRWKNDDYSHAVSDHNTIWNLQNGNVGKATGLLTEQEEVQYIEKHQ
ncbi:UNVERIFIED_CONTAM: DUF6241 domain-containing protein [Halobacillus marinus]|uniref:DUF6241 domain-containing protein n=1 Tax=Bacillus sp. SB49 TaxID=1071080 RepID=UPI00040CFBDC|nr:DUF6241 domain-containing protein [Bacillus sp. SB49]QHT45809.1 hypothetical protein M662_04550 [Bacillus sp. SB49]